MKTEAAVWMLCMYRAASLVIGFSVRPPSTIIPPALRSIVINTPKTRLLTHNSDSRPIIMMLKSPRRYRRGRERTRAALLAVRGDGDQADDDSSIVSNYQQTSDPLKALVGGLTDIFVWISGGREDTTDGKDMSTASGVEKGALSLEDLEAGIRQEYAKNYLWTGDINEALYELHLNCRRVVGVSAACVLFGIRATWPLMNSDERHLLMSIDGEACSFTDPTLSFSGLSTYKRNIASLQGVLNALVINSASILYSCQLQQEDSCVQTRWRMLGDLRLPWGPTIDVVGRTTFSYDANRGNRIFSYDEVWEIDATEALLQLFKPGRRRDDPAARQTGAD